MVQNSLVSNTDSNVNNVNNAFEDYTIIKVADRNYGIHANQILEIVKLVELDHPEGMLSCILGVIHFKQEPVGVLDLREIFKKDRIIYGIDTKVIIVQTQDTKAAIACDKVIDIKRIEKNKIFQIPYQKEADFFEGICSVDNEDVYIININKILNYICENSFLFSNVTNTNYIVDDEDSKEILISRKNALIELNNTVQTDISLYDSGVSFSVNDVKYYINMASVREFYKVKNSKFIKVPCTKDYIFGLINIKGEYITIIDIRKLYNNSKTTIKEKSTIIILNSDEYKMGILADEICESINVGFDEIVQNRLQKNEDNKMSQFVKDDEIYQVIDIEQLFKDDRLTVC
jgi:purine-binding chemotaxis protein CheW